MAVTIDGSGEISGLDEINNIALPTTGFGKVLQVVRATDATQRSTTSSSLVDVTGMTVSITPQQSTSNIFVISTFNAYAGRGGQTLDCQFAVTDSSNTTISGSGVGQFTLVAGGLSSIELASPIVLWGTVAAGSTSSRSYKLRFSAGPHAGTTLFVRNEFQIGQMYAIEVSA